MMSFALYFEPVAQTKGWIILLAFGIPFIGGLILYIYKTRHARSWRKGIFPFELKPSEDNFLEAYLSLGARLMLIDYHSSKGKIQFINSYFNRYFKFSNYNFSDSLLFSLRYPIQITSVTEWLKIHLKTEGERAQVIYFLAGLALVNGSILGNELQFLKRINTYLDLPLSNLTQILSIFASYEQTRKENNNQAPRSKSKTYSFEILGVSELATKEEIKKAYRKLVKIHHPDNFAQSSDSQQKMASEKFIEIQRAYESIIV